MSIFAIQVETRQEEKFIKLFRAQNPEKRISLYFPRRELRIRKLGRVQTKLAPVFAGYVFAEFKRIDELMHCHYALRHTNGFFRFLPSNYHIRQLQGSDLEIALHFIHRLGQIAGVSKVCFDENDKIVVKEGPLLGLEGHIVQIDRRKGRAKIKLDMYNEVFSIDLAFEVLEKVSTNVRR
jgi:transcriptional antiterminator NusG